MKTIWKFPIRIDDLIELEVPTDPKWIHCACQGGNNA